MTALIILLLELGWSGCVSDPILAEADQERAQETEHPTSSVPPPGAPPQPSPGLADPPTPGTGVLPPPGAPDQPLPGVPDEPPPGQPDTPAGQAGTPGAPNDGPTVTLSGVVRYPEHRAGKVRVDVFNGDQRDFSKRPGVVGWAELTAPGPFEVQVPQSAGKVWLSAFNDANNDGRPGHEDPTGYLDDNPVVLDQATITGLVIELVYNPPPDDP